MDGTQKTVDYTHILKIADFIGIDRQKAVRLYVKSLELNYSIGVNFSTEAVEFIKANFDIAALKKAKIISSISDYIEIETKIKQILDLKSIFEYRKPNMDVAFSAGLTTPKNSNTRAFWINAAKTLFEDIDNPNRYDRKALLDYFPKIRWHSTNVDHGLINVIRDLYHVGVTVIYQEPMSGLRVRGATFSVNDKPCIVLTNYVGYYPTLWFALIHELFHVLFDWEEIKNGGYHLSDDDNDILTVQEKEDEANEFAREYLFSKEKMRNIRHSINSIKYINQISKINQIHESFIYVFYTYDTGSSGGHIWGKAQKYNPDFSNLIKKINNSWAKRVSNLKFAQYLKSNIYS